MLTLVFIFVLILFALAIYRVPIWIWAVYLLSVTYLFTESTNVAVWLPALFFILFSIPLLRRIFLVRPIFNLFLQQASRISDVEKQALTAGNSGFEKGFFSGRPDWEMLRSVSPIKLTSEEQRIIDGPVTELCKITNDWDIRYKKREIPETLWNFVKKHKLFGLRVPKERGGYSFSFQAQSIILGMIASRSVDVATMVELPTSLWPDEIIEKYGSDEQKKYYMPRLADNKEIASFAITGASNGSDATSMRDVGTIEFGTHSGKEVLGIRLNIKKRYITFAPKATLLVLSFQLLDPKQYLKSGKDLGITLALIPANHSGIRTGRRHIPMNVAFPNGPIAGNDIFIPLEWVIGGKNGVGLGWKMIMECLFVGRAIAIPAMAISAIKTATRYSFLYARIRRQFGSFIGTFEGVEEPLVRLVEVAYVAESARTVTTGLVDAGYRPLAVSSLMKYKTTEYARHAVNDAIDIHGGRGVMDGPSNYLMTHFFAVPIGITVEGANIVTRSIITFAQGVLQAHPYLFEEMESVGEADKKQGLKRFENAILGHISFLISNVCRSFFHNITGGVFGVAPKKVPAKVRGWYRQLWRYSCSFASVSDITTILIRGQLKKRQKLGGRLADILSELYLLSSVLKRYEDDGFPEKDYVIIELCMKNGLNRIKELFVDAIQNFPVLFARPILFVIVFPFGVHRTPVKDKFRKEVAKVVLESQAVLNRLTRYIYISKDPNDITGRLEVAFEKAVQTEKAQKKLDHAVRDGRVMRVYGVDWIKDAEQKGILTKEEAKDVSELELLTERALAVDDFDPGDITGK